MNIWVDADACPRQVRDIILRAAVKRSVQAIFVANKVLALPTSEFISSVQVAFGADAADAYILNAAQDGDLVVTQDIPLAAQLVPRGITVISPRGDRYDHSNIGEILASRNLLQELRDTGAISGGPQPFNDVLKRKFAAAFDSALERLTKT